MRIRGASILVVLIASGWVLAPRVLACSCGASLTMPVALADADAVVLGEVRSVERAASGLERFAIAARAVWAQALGVKDPYLDDWYQSSRYGLVATIEVSEVFKGAEKGVLAVHTTPDGNTCGYPFVRGEKLVIFAHWQDDPLAKGKRFLFNTACGMTRKASEASDAIKELRALAREGKE